MRCLSLLAVALIGALTGACDASETEDSVESPASTAAAEEVTATTQHEATAARSGFDEELTESAWASVVAFFSTFNSGHGTELLALFAPDIVISDNFGGEWLLAEWAMLHEWNIAQGTVLTLPVCRASDRVAGDSVRVTCSTGTLDAPSQAVDGPAVGTNLTFDVTADGITNLGFAYSDPDFNEVIRPMGLWMASNHPDEVDTIGFGNWTTLEEARTNGARTAEFSSEWARYLAEAGCRYDEGC